jgi:hypothetical protein
MLTESPYEITAFIVTNLLVFIYEIVNYLATESTINFNLNSLLIRTNFVNYDNI